MKRFAPNFLLEHIEKSIELLQQTGVESHENAKIMLKQLKELQESYLK